MAVAGSTATGSEPDSPVCPEYRAAVELIGKRWTGTIVQALLSGPMRFSQLAETVPKISDRLLSTRLKELEANEIVMRTVIAGAPVRVEYRLTDKGRALEPSIAMLRRWAQQWAS